MSFYECHAPECHAHDEGNVELVVAARSRSIGAFSVGRVLPAPQRRMVGPFIFFDHMGPAQLGPGEGMDVRPHPHINLATVTYLFEGQIDHRDSLGFHQAIEPGAINWMTAGRGIVHSERSTPEFIAEATRLEGIQLWVALPAKHEEIEPSFVHHPAHTIPMLEREGAVIRVLVGEAWGKRSPVEALHPMSYIDVELRAGATLEVPDDHPERAAYVAAGRIRAGKREIVHHEMAMFRSGSQVELRAEVDSRVMLLAGAPMDGPRHIWWNFVSSRKERIEQAKADWKARRFPTIVDDNEDPMPLPD